MTWRRLTLHVEAAACASAWDDAIVIFVGRRHDNREVECTPRSDVIDGTAYARVNSTRADGKVHRIHGGCLGRRLYGCRARLACHRSGALKRTRDASRAQEPGAIAGSGCTREGQGNGPVRSRRMGEHNSRCRQ